MHMASDDKTFIEQIQANRVLADGTLSNSDSNDQSSDTSRDSLAKTRQVYRAEVHRPGTKEIRDRSASSMQPEVYEQSGAGTNSKSIKDSKEENGLVSCCTDSNKGKTFFDEAVMFSRVAHILACMQSSRKWSLRPSAFIRSILAKCSHIYLYIYSGQGRA